MLGGFLLFKLLLLLFWNMHTPYFIVGTGQSSSTSFGKPARGGTPAWNISA